MGRLTNYIDGVGYTCSYCENQEAVNKLGQLEDLMEKLDCADVESLRCGFQMLGAENTELKEKLENAIVIPYKIGQKVWFVNKMGTWDKNRFQVEQGTIENIRLFMLGCKTQINFRISDTCCRSGDRHSYKAKDLFLTETEAIERLRKLKGEK